MRKLFASLVLISAPVITLAGEQVELTNKDIIDMIGLGLNESVIITKIQHSKSNFDTSTESLKLLQDGGASSAIVTAVIETESRSASSGGDNDDYIGLVSPKGDAKLTEARFRYEESSRKKWIPFYGKFAGKEVFLFLTGKESSQEFSQDGIVFNTSIEPHRIRLLHFDVHKNGERFVVFSKGKSDREISLQINENSDGSYTLSPKEKLSYGEYAFLVNGDPGEINMNNNAFVKHALKGSFVGATTYDFRVGI